MSEFGDVSVCGELLLCLSFVYSVEEMFVLLVFLVLYFLMSGFVCVFGVMYVLVVFMFLGESGARLAFSFVTLRNDDSVRNVENSRLMGYVI